MKATLASRYNSEKLAGKTFDAIIIGSGVSGLATAALMARRGLNVIVLEKHYMAGGLTHYFKRKNFEWDVGLHYIGDVGSDKSFGKRLFDYVSDGKISWRKMSDPYDSAIFPDKTYEFISGHHNFLERMTEYFPQERKALEAYLDLLKSVIKQGDTFYALKTFPPFLGNPLSSLLSRKFHSYSDRTVSEVLSSLTQNEKLKSVLCTQWGDYGLPPNEASFVIHAMVANHYLRGGYFPEGGSKMIAGRIIETIRANGSDVYVRAEVDKLILKKSKCYGVRLKNGDEIYAKNVISSAGIFNTYKKFVDNETKNKQQINLELPLSKLERSVSHTALYLGLNKSAKDLNLRDGNQWIFPSYDHKSNLENFVSQKTKEFPVVYVSFPSSKDPLWEKDHPGTSTIDVISLMPYSHVSKWKETSWYKRGDEYLHMKEKVTEELLRKVIEHNPGIKDHIVVKELSSPLSTRHFSGYEEGEIYGLSHTPSRFRQKSLRPHTPIKNLYLTGQDIVSAGVMGALSSALISSIAVLKRNLKNDVMNG